MSKDATRGEAEQTHVLYLDSGEFWEIERIGLHGVKVKGRVNVLWFRDMLAKWRYATPEEVKQIQKTGEKK